MKDELNLVNPLHRRTQRDYLSRMLDDKVHCMGRAKEYESDYWDGERRYGYGGYIYDGRWRAVAERFIEHYGLNEKSRVLDIGCGKAHLLYELMLLLPGIEVSGIDVSEHGIATAPEEIRSCLSIGRAQDPIDAKDSEYDLVISVGCLHNLEIFDLKSALEEIERVGKQKFVLVESYRNDLEQFNLQCWALTAQAFFNNEEWKWLFEHVGYSGDYEFIHFE